MTATTVRDPSPGYPGDPDPRPLDPAPNRLIGFALVAGLALDVGLRGGVTNLSVAFGVAVVLLALLADQRLPRPEPRWLAGLAVVPALVLAVRASPWLAASNLLTIAGLTAAALSYARSGSVLDTTPARAVVRTLSAALTTLAEMVLATRLLPRPSSQTGDRVLRMSLAALVAVPILAVVVVLLASADAVFAGLVFPDVGDTRPVFGHLALTLLLALVVTGIGLGAATDAGEAGDDVLPRGRFGSVEITTMLGLAVAVLGLFVVSQLVAVTGAGRRLVHESGLTPAEYARTGFFQLCFASALLVMFLALVRALAAPSVLRLRSVRVLGATVPLLATGLVVVSLRRMALYDDAFGLTMLRLWVIGATIWMGAVLVMIAVRNGGTGDGSWVLAGAGAAALALVLLADVTNPEAVVVRHNVERARAGAELDVGYLSYLSDDAVPAIVAAAADPATDPVLRIALLAAMKCGEEANGVAALNLAAAQAADARAEVCTA